MVQLIRFLSPLVIVCEYLKQSREMSSLGGCGIVGFVCVCTEYGFKLPTHTCRFSSVPFSSSGLCFMYFQVLLLSAYTSGDLSHSQLVYPLDVTL